MALWTIAPYAREVGIAPLKQHHVRYFSQPWGWVGPGVDLDLATGAVVRYPGTRGKTNIPDGAANPESLAKLQDLIHSEGFKKLHEENLEAGCDGCSILIEADIDGNYSWKCHWCSENKVLREVAGLLQTLCVP